VEAIAEWLVNFVHGFGYMGIFIMTFFESTFVPVPAELTMVPAGYLVSQGEMNAVLVMIAAVLGTLFGSLANYYIAYHYGRRFLYAYGKYLLFPHEKMEKLDKFFASHGEISILTGRLVPGLRHFISFPAGLAHMRIKKFSLYTCVGGGIWMSVLVLLGYLIGGNKALVRHYTPYVTIAAIAIVVLATLLYIKHQRRKNVEENNGGA